MEKHITGHFQKQNSASDTSAEILGLGLESDAVVPEAGIDRATTLKKLMSPRVDLFRPLLSIGLKVHWRGEYVCHRFGLCPNKERMSCRVVGSGQFLVEGDSMQACLGLRLDCVPVIACRGLDRKIGEFVTLVRICHLLKRRCRPRSARDASHH